MSDYEEDWSELVAQNERLEAQLDWYRSTLVTILTLATASTRDVLTHERLAAICSTSLDKFPRSDSGSTK